MPNTIDRKSMLFPLIYISVPNQIPDPFLSNPKVLIVTP